MKRPALYSRSNRPPGTAAGPASPDSGSEGADAPAAHPAAPAAAAPTTTQTVTKSRTRLSRRDWMIALMLVVALAGGVVIGNRSLPAGQHLTQADIDAAVRHTLETKPIPSVATRAAAAVRPSVVRVRGLLDDEDDGETAEAHGKTTTGTGVVIVDKGLILTNLHVVAGARRIRVTFFDGLEADAALVNIMAENDLAVLQAKKLPDDLMAATMRSTGDLAPGDTVVAVGFPFGIGPSVSSGVVSGLKREFRSPDGKQMLTNLIQFDAAANPGNSGGPLVTADGEVVGIVTAILNPGEQRTFIGIGFAVPIENAAAAAGLPPF